MLRKLLRQRKRPILFKKFVCLVAIILMTGVMHTLLYSNFMINFVVTATYILGAGGLYTMYETFKTSNKRKRWLMLFCGSVCLLIAFITLEGLLRGPKA